MSSVVRTSSDEHDANSRDGDTEDFTNAKDTCGLTEWAPELCADVFCGVDTETVDPVLLDELLYPGVVGADDCRILGVDVWKGDLGVSEPAQLLAGRVAVVDGTVLVVERG